MVVLTTMNDLSYGIEECWMDTVVEPSIREAWYNLYEKRAKECSEDDPGEKQLEFRHYLEAIDIFTITVIDGSFSKVIGFNRYYGPHAFEKEGFDHKDYFTLTQFLDWVVQKVNDYEQE